MTRAIELAQLVREAAARISIQRIFETERASRMRVKLIFAHIPGGSWRS
jgi:hypothetical protein